MSINLCSSIVAIPFALGMCASEPCMAAGDRMAEHVPDTVIVAPPRREQATAMIVRTIPRAPIGHRQPRGDILRDVQLSPLDLELRRLDEEVDRQLIICRGC